MTRLLTGTGSYLPQRVVSNEELERQVTDFDPERAGTDLASWIFAHYGVRERHWAADGESTGDMATVAARRALEDAGVAAEELELIVMATATSDHVAPHSVSHVQRELGTEAVFHQLQDACPGFLNGLMVADSLMANLGYRRALVIAAEKMTHIVDPHAFRMVGLFADAAGAAVLEELDARPLAVGAGGAADAVRQYGFQGWYAGSDGAAGDALRVPAGGTRRPLTAERLAAGEQYLVSDFGRVREFAVRTVHRCVEEALARAGLRAADLAAVVPHHASADIVREGVGRAGVAPEQVVLSIEHTGNVSSASVPVALDEAARAGRFRDGDAVLLLALGGGMAWGSTVLRWSGRETVAAARARASQA